MKGLQIFNDKASGIDVGSESLHTSIAGDAPKVFGTMAADLYALRDHLVANGVRTVAMEATGIYWLCVYEVLEAAGLEVITAPATTAVAANIARQGSTPAPTTGLPRYKRLASRKNP